MKTLLNIIAPIHDTLFRLRRTSRLASVLERRIEALRFALVTHRAERF
jgi:hypothetical protein